MSLLALPLLLLHHKWPSGLSTCGKSRYNSSRAVSSLFCDSYRRCFCVYVVLLCVYCALLYIPGMCAWSVCSQKVGIQKQQAQQQHGGSRVSSSSRLCASSRGVRVCGWCPAGNRTTTTVSRPMQQSNTHRRTFGPPACRRKYYRGGARFYVDGKAFSEKKQKTAATPTTTAATPRTTTATPTLPE